MIEWIIDGCFIADILISFRTGYVREDGTLVIDNLKIAINYIRCDTCHGLHPVQFTVSAAASKAVGAAASAAARAAAASAAVASAVAASAAVGAAVSAAGSVRQ